jgi:hypothetical protein
VDAPYDLKSRVSLSDFQEFVSALQGTPVKVTSNNFEGLSQLCEEFHFRDLSAQLSQFRQFVDFKEDAVLLSALNGRILAMEEQLRHGEREIALLRCKVSRQSAVQKSFEKSVRTEVEHHITEVRGDVATLREALREVRDLAEGAQTKAESTAARLEAEASALRTAPAVPAFAVPPPPSGWNSAIVCDFPKLFEDFKEKQFTLLWRDSRDRFGAADFHNRCDGHPNTLTVILDTDGNIFGGFTPVEWDSLATWPCKADPSLKSFAFTLKNPQNVPARRFALKAERKDEAIWCVSERGPHFNDISVSDNCNANTNSWTELGRSYTNDTGLDGQTFFTGSEHFQGKEIEVFEIKN